ncbi:hypothetical protein PVK06_008364 [Gossypium arboreum]|uniref:Uncharacterized protein n=1 Tax=Gossypium arboreum TaxID=29729 RepID=A0ABR0QJZ5_GOSAR|nr:hypothetical protein PVK06_008364 [Gossypium arboreum]
MVPKTLVSKFENGDADGGVVEVKRLNNRSYLSSYSTPMVLSDMDEYHAIFKNKLHQVCMIVAFSHASVVKAGGSSAQVEIQALQSDLMFKVPSIQEQGEPNYGSELFKNSSIVYACCSPLIPEESVVLLENVGDDQFLAFSKAGATGFQCVLASKGLLLLCDVRTPMVPLLYWAHDLDNPCFIDVIRLLKLRSQSRNETYQWATKSYFCIMLDHFGIVNSSCSVMGLLQPMKDMLLQKFQRFANPF